MKTYFVEILMNNKGITRAGTRFLRCIVTANNKEHAENKALTHYSKLYTGGDSGRFYPQCCWVVSVPKRELIEKMWRAFSRSLSSINNYRYFQTAETKKETLEVWDNCNSAWASVPVAYNPKYGGYTVSIHNHMEYETVVKVFKGNTAKTYDKARSWVKENTFCEDYFRD